MKNYDQNITNKQKIQMPSSNNVQLNWLDGLQSDYQGTTRTTQ